MDDLSIIIVIGSLLFLGLLFFIIAFLFLYQRRHAKHLMEKDELKFHFSQTLLQSQLEIQEQTLQQISRELHDNLGHSASIIKINLNTIKLDDPVKTLEKIEDTKELTRQLIGDIKSLSISLNGDRIAKTGLVKAIETEVERLNKTGLFIAEFSHHGHQPPVDHDKSVILYRMAQEVLNNAAKHSNAKQINVNLNVTENLFILAFSDNGDGFDVEKQLQSSGSGLQNLHNRARLINATLTIQSVPGSGTTTIVQLPL
ncbi:MAG: ATP-binding protein [Ferruginibacter sp.]